MIQLICYIFGICSAWCWRSAINYSIYDILGFNDDSTDSYKIVVTYWCYILLFQICVTLINVHLRLKKK